MVSMAWEIVGAAVALGFLGSLHCAAMCGPIAVAGCCRAGRASTSRVLSYLGGRLVAYALAGAAFGAVGAHLGCKVPLHTLQLVTLALVVAFALVRGVRLLGAHVRARRSSDLVVLKKKPSSSSPIASFVATLVPRRAVWLGVITGALPCGMLLGAWALAASTGRPLDGALSMIAFSFASAPALLLGLFAARAATRWRWASTPLFQGVLWCALALWIGARSFLPHTHGMHGAP